MNVPLKNYSQGMISRLGFAIAVDVNPDVLLIDEILAVGDAVFQKKCAEKIDELRKTARRLSSYRTARRRFSDFAKTQSISKTET